MIIMIVASFMKFIRMTYSDKSDIERREYNHIAMCQHGDRFVCLCIQA